MIKRTQTFHKVVPLKQSNCIAVYQTSASKEFVKCKITSMLHKGFKIYELEIMAEYHTGQYIVCTYEWYDHELWIAIIEEIDSDFEDFHISFLKTSELPSNQ